MVVGGCYERFGYLTKEWRRLITAPCSVLSELKMLRLRAEWLKNLGKLVKANPEIAEQLVKASVLAENELLSSSEARDLRQWITAVSLEVV